MDNTTHTTDQRQNLSKNLSSNQYLTFFLAEEEYGINILHIVEIRGWENATPLPDSPPFMKGIINLRGNIIPVIDLRLRFGLPEIDYTALTVCIVLQVNHEGSTKTMGVVVDTVSDVYTVNHDLVQDKPEMCSKNSHQFIEGLITIKEDGQEEKLVILLNSNKLLNGDELSNILAS